MPKAKQKTDRDNVGERSKRCDNFSSEEIEVLVKEVVARKGVIQEPLSATVTWQKKQSAWQGITEAVNIVSSSMRSLEEVKIKLNNLKSKAKKNYLQRKKAMNMTGGGEEPPKLPLWEELLLDFSLAKNLSTAATLVSTSSTLLPFIC